MTAKRACSQCGKPNAQPPARLCYTCKKANGKAAKARAHDRYVVETYGISAGDYAKLLALQGGVCAICGGKGGGKRLALDHNHATGQARGLLDRNCNFILLGRMAKDDPDRLTAILSNAVAYLQDPPYQRMLRNDPHD